MTDKIYLAEKGLQIEIKQSVDDVNAKLNAGVGKILKSKVYESNGTFVVPAGVTEVYLTGGGAGGGGGYGATSGSQLDGKTGGITSFGFFLSLSGGGGGYGGYTSAMPGGTAGGPGGSAGEAGVSAAGMLNGNGGSSGPYYGGQAISGTSGHYPSRNGGFCSGGAGGQSSGGGYVSSGGGGGHFVYDKEVTVTPGSTISVVIGVGGEGGHTSSSGRGGNGILIVKWWE